MSQFQQVLDPVAGSVVLSALVAAIPLTSLFLMLDGDNRMVRGTRRPVAAAAVGMVGKEGDIFRRLIGWSLGMLAVFTVLVYLQSTVLSWMVP